MKTDKHHDIPDQQLLENFYKDHNNEWLGVLLQRYTLLLLGVCMKYLKNEEEAKDCVQQLFLKAITELHKYKVDYFKSWIYMVAKNHCLMKLRNRQGRTATEITENLLATPAEEPDQWDRMQKEITYEMLEAALKELSSEQQQCLTLFYLQKKSYSEICELTGFNMLQVKSYIQNGKRNLKNSMEIKLKQGKIK
ncbi:MAG TPA: sigma-70 family RNA polymerase sigma factor [Chitinophagaceae bacterium]